MAELTRDIAEYLIAEEEAEGVGTDIMLDYTADTPDDLIIIGEYNGPPPAYGVQALERRVQIKIRNASYPTARAKAWAVFSALVDTVEPEKQLTAERWATIWARQTPALLERDDKGRSVFVFNLGVSTYQD